MELALRAAWYASTVLFIFGLYLLVVHSLFILGVSFAPLAGMNALTGVSLFGLALALRVLSRIRVDRSSAETTGCVLESKLIQNLVFLSTASALSLTSLALSLTLSTGSIELLSVFMCSIGVGLTIFAATHSKSY